MQIKNKLVVITGAAGGIGRETVRLLSTQGARLALVDRDENALQQLLEELALPQEQSCYFCCDLLQDDQRDSLLENIISQMGEIDVLVNMAGMLSFNHFIGEDPCTIDRIMQLNSIVPMQLIHQLIPHLMNKEEAQVVNVGSTFGSIGFAYFATYSASKFALRGFSEALRRELQDTSIDVKYIAPRAVKTSLNTDAIYAMGQATGMNMDEPADVAGDIVGAITGNSKERYLGFPEKLFVRINAILPRLVDKALAGQNRIMSSFAGSKVK